MHGLTGWCPRTPRREGASAHLHCSLQSPLITVVIYSAPTCQPPEQASAHYHTQSRRRSEAGHLRSVMEIRKLMLRDRMTCLREGGACSNPWSVWARAGTLSAGPGCLWPGAPGQHPLGHYLTPSPKITQFLLRALCGALD